MKDFEHESVSSPTYPGEEECQITLDATSYGMLEASFEFAVTDHGNDRAATWPCYTDSDEKFTLSYEGKGSTFLEGKYWGIWHLTFDKEGKTLRIDVGNNSVERFDTATYIPASFRDISDLVAAYLNLSEYNYQQELNGSITLHMLPIDLGIKPEGLEPNPDTG